MLCHLRPQNFERSLCFLKRVPPFSRHYDEPISYEAPAYDSYGYGHAPPASSRAPYEVPEYEPAEYRREYYPHSPSYPGKLYFSFFFNPRSKLFRVI